MRDCTFPTVILNNVIISVLLILQCRLGEGLSIVVIGSGPTSLGFSYRLNELEVEKCGIKVTILEQEGVPGGLATTHKDENGFLWDNGGHVVFSHYKYFDHAIEKAVADWNLRKRAAYALMMGSSGKRKFIPYPVQDNIHVMDSKEQALSLKGLQEVIDHPMTKKPENFDQWLVKNFGEGLCDIFMRRYNRKVWTVNTEEMNSVWVGERVAVPDINKIRAKIAGKEDAKDSEWGPNRFFRFPRYGGTGGIWNAVSKLLPQEWFHYDHKVVGLDVHQKTLTVQAVKSGQQISVNYDFLVSTIPLDILTSINSNTDDQSNSMEKLASDLVYSHTHIIGIGLSGQAPKQLSDKSWMYFPDSDSPFYRVTVFSNYSDDHVPKPGVYWSLMCEVAEPKVHANSKYWTKESLLHKTVDALVLYGFISQKQVISKFYHRLSHGYPIPTLGRESILAIIQPWLQSNNIYSRGRFGGWRYEVGNQDHSFMQGVELADLLIRGIPEETYPHPELVNVMKASDRFIK